MIAKDARRGIKIVAGGERFDFTVGNSDERVDRFATGPVVFADGDDLVAAHNHVGETEAGPIGKRRGIPVKLLVGIVDENHVAAGHGIGAASVFVDPRTDTEAGRREVAAIANENGAAALAGPLFQPGQVIPPKCNRAETDIFAGNEAGRDRRLPSTVGRKHAIILTGALQMRNRAINRRHVATTSRLRNDLPAAIVAARIPACFVPLNFSI